MASSQKEIFFQIGHRLDNSCSLRENASIQLKVPAHATGTVSSVRDGIGLSALCTAKQFWKEALGVHCFLFCLDNCVLTRPAYLPPFLICSKNGSSVDLARRNNSMAVGEIYFMNVVKVLTGCSSFTEVKK